MKQAVPLKVLKQCVFAVLPIALWACWTFTAFAAPYEKGYDKRAQDLIHTMITKNGLNPETWPDYKPSQWPRVDISETYPYPHNFGVRWSNSPVKKLIQLVLTLEEPPLYGPVDLSGLDTLKLLYICGDYEGKTITSLNIKGNHALENLTVRFTNLTHVDVSEAEKLTYLSLESCDKLTSLNLNRNRQLTELSILVCPLGSLDLSQNLGLRRLFLSSVPLAKLDLNKNLALQDLYIGVCPINRLDMSAQKALTDITLYETAISSLDLRHSSALKAIEATKTPLGSLTLPGKLNKTKLFSQFAETRLPLSHLAQMTGKHTFIDTQFDVFFAKKVFQPGEKAELDFSAEAELLGAATSFTLMKQKNGPEEVFPVSKSNCTVKNGRVTITQPGRYHVLMTNPKVLTNIGDTPQEISVFTGVIVVKGVKN